MNNLILNQWFDSSLAGGYLKKRVGLLSTLVARITRGDHCSSEYADLAFVAVMQR